MRWGCQRNNQRSPKTLLFVFRRFTCRPAAFLSVWGGQPEREASLFNLKFLAARVRVYVRQLADGEVCLKVSKDKGKDAHELLKMFYAWKEQVDKLSSEEISKEEYDNWRYHYPKFDTTQRWAKVPSQELSDALVESFKDHLND